MKQFSKTTIGIFTALIFSSSIALADQYTTSNTSGINTNVINQNTQKYVSDSMITTQIKEAFLKSPILRSSDIKVATQNGIVFLSGLVDTKTQYSEAVSSAEAIPGVKSVNVDKLTVKNSKAPLEDTFITAQIKGVYIKEGLIGTDVSFINTHVETKNGIVYLSGTLDNSQQINNAIQLAKSIEGVKEVKSTLKTK